MTIVERRAVIDRVQMLNEARNKPYKMLYQYRVYADGTSYVYRHSYGRGIKSGVLR